MRRLGQFLCYRKILMSKLLNNSVDSTMLYGNNRTDSR